MFQVTWFIIFLITKTVTKNFREKIVISLVNIKSNFGNIPTSIT